MSFFNNKERRKVLDHVTGEETKKILRCYEIERDNLHTLHVDIATVGEPIKVTFYEVEQAGEKSLRNALDPTKKGQYFYDSQRAFLFQFLRKRINPFYEYQSYDITTRS